MSELDICQCGDYRKNHVNNEGACKVCGDDTYIPCLAFRLFTVFDHSQQKTLDFDAVTQ